MGTIIMRFSDKVCIVTGGGSGIGRATCERLAHEGARVAVADVNSEHLFATVEAVRKLGGAALPVLMDVSKLDQIRDGIRTVVKAFQRIDVIVNNAAVMTFDPIERTEDDDWERVLTINLTAVFRFCKYALPHMPPGSAIINISSVH